MEQQEKETEQAAKLPEKVDLADLRVLVDLQKELGYLKELAKTKIELFEHKIVIIQSQLKVKYQMTDLDTIDSESGKINRQTP